VETPPEDNKRVEGGWPDGKKECLLDTQRWFVIVKSSFLQVPPPLRWRKLKGGAK
jgi:hypothetical protein